jgi:hypothetical protein
MDAKDLAMTFLSTVDLSSMSKRSCMKMLKALHTLLRGCKVHTVRLEKISSHISEGIIVTFVKVTSKLILFVKDEGFIDKVSIAPIAPIVPIATVLMSLLQK